MKGGKVVTDTSISKKSYAIWCGPERWEEKRGPLKKPDEPWHWVLGT